MDLLHAGVNIRCKNQMLVKERQRFIIDTTAVRANRRSGFIKVLAG
jgi:hypothetical protein